MSLHLPFYTHRTHQDLHSFPTRRSSDLRCHPSRHRGRDGGRRGSSPTPRRPSRHRHIGRRRSAAWASPIWLWRERSEEHTSELQSHSDLVCRLLLEKKKNKKRAE